MSVTGVVRETSPITAEEYQIIGNVVGGTNLSLTVPDSVLGHEYQIWTTANLMDATWQPVGAIQTGIGTVLNFDIPIESEASSRYFKVDVQRP